jgi:hypothetical protein
MNRIGLLALSLCLISFEVSHASAAESMTPNTLRLAQGESSPAATIDEMAWYAGAWRGTGLGGDNEEIWSAPKNGTMLGMYRLLKADHPAFYELLTIVQEQASLTLSLKHFDSDLRGWEEREQSVRMPLVAKRDGRIYFDGLTFEPHKDGTVTIYVAIQPKDGQLREEVFRYERQP